jgi:tRNA threonylcarbamoyladenosine biosynthesis protein TsaB
MPMNMQNDKPLLAIETSEKNCGVCLYFNTEKYFEFSFRLKHAHSEKIFELIEKLYKASGSSIRETKAIAVSSGPGSFTGLRIGMAAAKGLAFGSSLPIIPVPTFEAMAMQLSDVLADSSSFVLANKVNADEIYFAKFQVKGNNYIFVEKLSIIKHSNLHLGDELVFGNVTKVVDDNEKDFEFASPDAKYIARWAEKFGKDRLTYNYDYLQPDYLKDLIIKD